MEYSRSMLKEMETFPFHTPKSLLDHGDIIYNSDPYLKPLKSSDFSKFNINTSVKLIKKYLNPADYTFVFVGNIDINVFREYVETYLASIHSGKEKSMLPKYRAVYVGNQRIKIYDMGTYSKEHMYFIIRDQYFQSNELVIDVLEEYLKNIFNKYVTTKYIESFYVNGKNNVRRMITGVGDLLFSIVFSCEPDKIDENIATIKEDLKKIANSNINLDSFNKAKNTVKTEYIKRLQENMWLSERYAIFSVIYEKSFNDIYEQQKMYDTVTPKDLQKVVAKTLNEGITCILEYPGPKNSRSGEGV
jgi:zinc protease